MAEYVRITEVGPRDGLQNEPGVIPTPEKVRLVELCAATGVDEVEVTSFVSPKWVPQLGDAAELISASVKSKPENAVFSALVPNERGMESFVGANQAALTASGRPVLDKVCLLTAASETFCKRNLAATIPESFERMRPILLKAARNSLQVKFYVSCSFACPFEGPIEPKVAVDWILRAAGMTDHSDYWPDRDNFDSNRIGKAEVSISDTIGAATPHTTQRLLKLLKEKVRDGYYPADFSLHFHDTKGHAADCVKAALDLGIRSFDGSVAGLGGCPYASTPGKRAPGNISTETLVRTIHDAGFETGVDLDKLAEAAAYARQIVDRARASAGRQSSGGPCA